MLISPAAMLCLATGAVLLVRRLEVPPRVLRYETWLGRAAVAGMIVFLSGALCWVSLGGPAQAPFHAGDIDAAGLAVLVAALVIGGQAASRAKPASASGPR